MKRSQRTQPAGKVQCDLKRSRTGGRSCDSEKLIAFAKEAGFDATLAEMQDFFKK
jgi:uncharacterized protein YmfQ (DUF2313 family)